MESCPRCWASLDELRMLGAFNSVAVSRVCVVLKGTYNIGKSRYRHLLIKVGCTLIHVKFGVGLFIMVSRYRITLYKESGVQNQ